jgi:hypothetical protein
MTQRHISEDQNPWLFPRRSAEKEEGSETGQEPLVDILRSPNMNQERTMSALTASPQGTTQGYSWAEAADPTE